MHGVHSLSLSLSGRPRIEGCIGQDSNLPFCHVTVPMFAMITADTCSWPPHTVTSYVKSLSFRDRFYGTGAAGGGEMLRRGKSKKTSFRAKSNPDSLR